MEEKKYRVDCVDDLPDDVLMFDNEFVPVINYDLYKIIESSFNLNISDRKFAELAVVLL